MTVYTHWYNLDKYEGIDKPNLLDQYNTALDKIDSEMKALQNQINGGSTDMESRVSALEKPNYNYYNGKIGVFIGDSFTVGQGCSDYATTRLNRYSTLVCAALGLTERNFAVGSTGFVETGSGAGHNDPFTRQITNAYNSMSQIERDNTALVVVAGGLNDKNGSFTHQEMVDAAGEVAYNASVYFPNAKILIIPMLYKGFNFTPKAHDFYNAIIEGARQCQKASIVEGAYTWNWGDGTHFNTDKIHPNDAGYRVIADNILTCIASGNLICWEDHIYELTYPNSNFHGASGEKNIVMIKNGVVIVNAGRIEATTGFNSNTRVANIPKCVSPLRFVDGFACNSAQPIGLCVLTNDPAFFVNPYVQAFPNNSGFNYSSFTYDLYGTDYND